METNVFSVDKFSERLKELRDEKTLQEVADGVGITRVAMGYYEKGERKPDVEILFKIADYYKVSADYLIGLSDVKTPDIDIQGIAAKTGLSERTIEKICSINNLPHNIEPLNILLLSANFESALFHIGKYIEAVKDVEALRIKRREMLQEVFSEEPDNIIDDKPIYNWPYNDNFDKNYKESEQKMILEEYSIDKAFKYIIQEIEQNAKK